MTQTATLERAWAAPISKLRCAHTPQTVAPERKAFLYTHARKDQRAFRQASSRVEEFQQLLSLSQRQTLAVQQLEVCSWLEIFRTHVRCFLFLFIMHTHTPFLLNAPILSVRVVSAAHMAPCLHTSCTSNAMMVSSRLRLSFEFSRPPWFFQTTYKSFVANPLQFRAKIVARVQPTHAGLKIASPPELLN